MAGQERNSEDFIRGLRVGESAEITVTAGDKKAKGIMKKVGEKLVAEIGNVQFIESSYKITDRSEGDEDETSQPPASK